ncbi:MAG: DUF2931 family protein, partial [Sphingobacteriales bacterium]
MKVNFVNKIFLAVGVVLLAAIAWKIIKFQSWNRYYYAASVSAPQSFPVFVREIYFTTADDNVWMDTEKVNGFNSSWAQEDYFPDVHESNLLPEKIVLKYASFREGSFYSDTIPLPADKLKAAVDAAFKNNNTVDIYFNGMQKTGLSFLVGIANNGNIIIWLTGAKQTIEIMRAKINAKPPGAEDLYYGGDMSKSEYLKDRFSMLSDSMKTLI